VQPEPPVEIMMPETIIAESVAPPETPAAASYPPITINVYSAPQVQQVQPPPQPQPLPPPQPQPQPQPPPQPLPQLQPQPQQQPLPPPQPQQFRHRQHHFRERDRERQEQQSPKFSEQVQPEEQPEPLPPLIPAEALPPPPMLPPPVPLTPPDTGIKVVPNIKPLPDSVYRIQVGSFKVPRHAVEAFDKLKAVGLNPSYEPSGEFYRVVIARIPGTEVQSVIDSIAKAGFREVLLREER
ncbi:MAG: SPOR domain-containing protein, partial [Treponema sp.]|nr:SPOR domain-containing protein [Treponema sp.]